MKVVMQGTESIAANSTNPNVLTGLKYERSPQDSIGACFNTGSATGLQADLNVGGYSVSDTINVGSANRTPVVPDDLLIDDWDAPHGDLIQLKVENTTAGALVYQFRIELLLIPDQ